MRRIIAGALSLVLAAGLLPLPAFAAGGSAYTGGSASGQAIGAQAKKPAKAKV